MRSQESALKRKAYKAKYYQDNKEAIQKRRKLNPKVTKEKSKEYYVRYKYGVDMSEIRAYFIVQKGRCAICDIYMDGKTNGTKPHIDHCHATKNIRGLLCHNCNVGIGHLKDSVDILKKSIKYLGGKIE